MSKIGKLSISIPEKVKVVLNGNLLNIEGPLGKKVLNLDLNIFDLNILEGKEVSIKPKVINENTKKLWGMNRSLINNAVIGSSTGYEKTLELVENYTHYVSSCLEKLPKGAEVFILGDFNCDLLKTNNLSSLISDLCKSKSFTQHVKDPTRVTEHSSTD